MLQGDRLHCLTILGRPSCGLTPRKVAVFPAVRSEAIGTSVWTGRALQVGYDGLEIVGLAHLYSAL